MKDDFFYEFNMVTLSTIKMVNYAEFIRDKETACKKAINNIGEIENIKPSKYVFNGEEIHVEITYSTSDFNPYTIYFIEDLKPEATNSSKYKAVLNNSIISVTNITDMPVLKQAPVRIEGSRNSNLQRGEIVMYPLTQECFVTNVLQYPEVIPIYPKTYKPKFSYKDQIIKNSFDVVLKSQKYYGLMHDIKFSETLPEKINPNTAYVINGQKIKTLPAGILVTAYKRKPEQIMFIPTVEYQLSAEDIDRVKHYLQMEEIQFKSWCYFIEQHKIKLQ